MAVKRNMGLMWIDGEKLRKAINDADYSLSEASELIGMKSNYLSHIINNSAIKSSSALLVEHVLGIPFSVYAQEAPEPEPEQEPGPEPEQVDAGADPDDQRATYLICNRRIICARP